jgi:hypothetical protein
MSPVAMAVSKNETSGRWDPQDIRDWIRMVPPGKSMENAHLSQEKPWKHMERFMDFK